MIWRLARAPACGLPVGGGASEEKERLVRDRRSTAGHGPERQSRGRCKATSDQTTDYMVSRQIRPVSGIGVARSRRKFLGGQRLPFSSSGVSI